jgi:hypothetical protein
MDDKGNKHAEVWLASIATGNQIVVISLRSPEGRSLINLLESGLNIRLDYGKRTVRNSSQILVQSVVHQW